MSVPMTRCQDKVSCCKYDIWVNYILLSLIFSWSFNDTSYFKKNFLCIITEEPRYRAE